MLTLFASKHSECYDCHDFLDKSRFKPIHVLPAAQPAQEESQIVLLANCARKYPRIHMNAPNFSPINEFEPKTIFGKAESEILKKKSFEL